MRYAVALLGLTGCMGFGNKEPGADIVGKGEFCDVRRVFAAECVSCHDSALASGGLDLQTDPVGALVNVPSTVGDHVRVVPGDSARSFLWVKMAGTQAGTDGDAMPPPLGSTSADVVARWIDDGASGNCDDGGTGGGVDPGGDTATVVRHHPTGYGDAAVHGPAALVRAEDCTSCHGADLTGGTSGVSCDACHETGWRTDCVYCHGGVDNTTGAPPRDISADVPFPPHTAHVTENIKPGYDCVECHRKPTDVLSSGHVFVDDATPGVAEVDFSGGIAAGATWDGTTCTAYCHGDGQAPGTQSIADPAPSCGSCHAVAATGDPYGLSGEHGRHVSHAVGCEECHAGVVAAGDTVIAPALHVNGTPDLSFPSGMAWDATRLQCTGTCHGEVHTSRHW